MYDAKGFSLLEVLVALAILAVAVWSIAHVSVYTARSSEVARRLTLGAELAADKLNQLRSLAWSIDDSGLPTADLETDLTVYPERPSGGTGLRSSPPDALDRNTPGYCDFLDAHGRSLGGGVAPPGGASFVRRWSVTRLAVSPTNALLLQVRLLSPDASRRGVPEAVTVTLTTVRARLAP
jgi:prepilin-type N-terminal cleavage/methylation domain-containing protein